MFSYRLNGPIPARCPHDYRLLVDFDTSGCYQCISSNGGQVMY
jgi:hypothetical protein